MPAFLRMKNTALLGAILTIPITKPYCQQPIFSAGQVYDENRIGSRAYPLGNAALNQTHSYSSFWLNGSVPFERDGIVGLASTIHSDNQSEAFPAHRLNNWIQYEAPENLVGDRTGAWVEYFRFAGTNPSYFSMVSNNNRRNFFTSAFPFTSLFPPTLPRQFSSTTYSRGYSKVDFICPSACGTSNVSTYYFKIGGWNMSGFPSTAGKPSVRFPLPTGTLAKDIVNMEAVIHSDDNGNNLIVDKLDHIAKNYYTGGTEPLIIGKGGGIWFGNGCRPPYCASGTVPSSRIILFAGMTKANTNQEDRSSYRGANFQWNSSTPAAKIPYSSEAKNRGWVKIEFFNKTLPLVPYTFKSRSVAIGAWNMQTAHRMTPIPLSRFGISADRIVGMSTTIQSDPKNGESIDMPGWQLTDFTMHPMVTPPGFESNPTSGGGGVTLVRGGFVHAVSYRKHVGTGQLYNYYSKNHSLTSLNGATYNRGWVKLDYLAGSCEQGISGFNIQAIPGNHIGGCGNSASTFAFEASGSDVWNSADDFTFMSKSGSNNKDLIIRVDAQASSDGWARTGIMIRESKAPGARHASIFVTPSNGIRFTYRENNNQTTFHSGANSLKAPYFIRLQKSGTTFTAFARPNTSSNWTTIGTKSISNFANTNYFYGLAQTSKMTTLAKTTFSNQSGF